MAFTLPTFNLTCNVFTPGVFGAPRLSSVCNLAQGKRGLMIFGNNYNVQLLCPKLTDVRSELCVGQVQGDWIECPAASGRWYNVTYVDDVGKGFANEYRLVWMVGIVGPFGAKWPAPIP